MQQDPPTFPLFWDVKNLPITARGVIRRHKRRVHRERVSDIGVDWAVIPMHLPIRGNWQSLPIRVVELGIVELLRDGLRRLSQLELPVPAQRPRVGQPLGPERGAVQRGAHRVVVVPDGGVGVQVAHVPPVSPVLQCPFERVLGAERHVRVPLPPPEEGGVLPGLVRGVRGREHRAARGRHRHYGGTRIPKSLSLSVLNSNCSSISRAEDGGRGRRT